MLGTASDEGNKDSQDEIDRVSDRVAAAVAYFPPVKLSEILELKNRFPALDFDPKLADSVSPLLFVTSDDPPTLIVHGDKDDLVKPSNSERIKAAFDKEKVPCELLIIKGAGHGFAGKDAEQAANALVGWFDKYLTNAADGSQAKSESEPEAAPAAR
jgi:dienelactone hydrolase